jgi:hypothetical protein
MGAAFIFVCAAFLLQLVSATAEASDEIVAGYIARATLDGYGVDLKAKLDTGADSSSINAAALQFFRRDGRRWARFDIVGINGTSVTIEETVTRTVRIKRSGSKSNVRPVIRLKVCVAGKTAETDFTLADRSQLNYQVLIGRRFLKDRILVDSGREMVHPNKCG